VTAPDFACFQLEMGSNVCNPEDFEILTGDRPPLLVNYLENLKKISVLNLLSVLGVRSIDEFKSSGLVQPRTGDDR